MLFFVIHNLINLNSNNIEEAVKEVQSFHPKESNYINIFGNNVADVMLNKIYNIKESRTI